MLKDDATERLAMQVFRILGNDERGFERMTTGKGDESVVAISYEGARGWL